MTTAADEVPVKNRTARGGCYGLIVDYGGLTFCDSNGIT